MSRISSALARSRRALAAGTALLLLPLLGLTALAPAASAAAGLTASYSGADRQGKYVISNPTAAAITGWKIEFDLPAGTTVSNTWYGKTTVSGNRVTIDHEHYNARVNPGATTEPYSPTFQLTGTGVPANCRINGNKCDGAADRGPEAPTGLRSIGKTTKTVTLAWTAAVAGDFPVAGYEITGGAGVVSVTGTSGTVTGLTPNTDYTFTVKARDTRGNLSPASAAVTVRTNNPGDDTQPPTVPGNLRSTGKTSTSVALAWNASTDNSGIANYDIYRDGVYAATVTGTSSTVEGLSPSTAYRFTVRARDNYDNQSALSNEVAVTTDDLVGPGKHARVGYFVQWGIYGRQFFVRNLDTSGAAAKLTHINYAFANIDPVNLTCLQGVTKGTSADPQDPNQGDGAGDAEADYSRPFAAGQSVDGVADTGWEPLRGNYNQLRKLKAKHPHLKVLISLGGWTYSKYFSDVAATDAARKKFVSSCLDIYIKGNLPTYNGAGGAGSAAGIFDGIDLDWEWPGAEGHAGNHISPNDKRNNTLLVAEFRRQLDALGQQNKKQYQLTAFTPADPAKVDAGWEISGPDHVFKYLDMANVQGYDFHGAGSDNSWEPKRTGHQGNLYTDTEDPYNVHFSVENAVNHYLKAGVNPRKLTIGFAYYGRGWQQVTDGGKKGEWQAANGAAPGQFAEEAGTRGYSNLLASVPGMTIHHDEQSVSTYGYTGNNGQWWSFDDAWSIGKKTAWLKSKNLLGAMVWEMSGDTGNGSLTTALDNGLR
ncbi:glycosyl hydrolase family 18 protein [Crossiella sp. CA-258035]|uniref:glycosyl hydrolase family 18 protein n=1 Tax=Crossiella sp. CA-258035 TaxID=2981138 RepID=UPI0024BC7410|nr:glycosyl hydrolase family 18 protein [Crossiella sp. CA-258035]WHT17362.1 glycosyl hydrolase family 18 protein [Crossiella sp. CA-258035]